MTRSAWERRIERAEELAQTSAPAGEILRFYAHIARFQKSVFEGLEGHPDVAVLLPHFAPLVALVKRVGPAPLAQAAEERARWEGLLERWRDAGEGERFFARCLLQPYTEYLAGKSEIASSAVQPLCPFCGEKPQAGVLRGEGEGAKRSLVCSLCSTEWDFRRILCPSCGEENERNMPVYTAEEFPHVRIEACDTCHVYIKSVNLTRNGLAVPVVDEMATVSLNFWAEEHGYAKLQANLLEM